MAELAEKRKQVEEQGFTFVEEQESLNMEAFRGGMDFFLQGGKSETQSVAARLRSLKNF
ncbi:MAG: hypothetical protein IJU50_06400 [Lachnospiraceae bacterium]|nr:hypothetical protein [Lachnospiraceae bacterium]